MTASATDTFLDALSTAFSAGTFIGGTIAKPAPTASSPDLRNIYLRPVALKDGPHLAFTYRYAHRDEAKNYPLAEAVERLRTILGPDFWEAYLRTSDGEGSLKMSKKGQATYFFKKNKARKTLERAEENTTPTGHDHAKKRLLDPALPWLNDLGITGRDGNVLAHAQDKWRQINKYLEVMDSLTEEHPLRPDRCRIADMGSGKGYLTFALFDFLKNKKGLHGLQLTGVELRPHLVEFCQATARRYPLEGLDFAAVDIADFAASEPLDALIALHACDTATDLAIAQGIRAGAGLLVLAPCCHKQVRRDMHIPATGPLAPFARHGILLERQAEMLTDTLRALLMEAHGYRVKVFEFISPEHTAKNVMLAAIKRKIVPAGHTEARLAEAEALKQAYGLSEHYLEKLLR